MLSIFTFTCACARAPCSPSAHPNRGQLGRDKFKDCKSHCPRWRRAATASPLGNGTEEKIGEKQGLPPPSTISPPHPREAFWNVRWPAWDGSIYRAAQLTAQSAVTVHKSIVQQVDAFAQTVHALSLRKKLFCLINTATRRKTLFCR